MENKTKEMVSILKRSNKTLNNIVKEKMCVIIDLSHNMTPFIKNNTLERETNSQISFYITMYGFYDCLFDTTKSIYYKKAKEQAIENFKSLQTPLTVSLINYLENNSIVNSETGEEKAILEHFVDAYNKGYLLAPYCNIKTVIQTFNNLNKKYFTILNEFDQSTNANSDSKQLKKIANNSFYYLAQKNRNQ